MKRIILMLAVCAMFMTGCGCSNKDTNNDGIIGNDAANDNSYDENDSVMDNNMTDDNMADDNMADDNVVNNDATNNSTAGDMVGDAVDGVENAAGDLARGAGRVMNDVGNAMR